MTTIQQLVPSNYTDAKAKFLADPTHNPQFEYEEPLVDEELEKFGAPLPEYLEIAQHILNKAYFGRNEDDLIFNDGKVLAHHEVEEKINTFLEMHHLQNRFSIIWSDTFIARASITSDTLKLRSTAEFRDRSLIGTIYHELGTHALRRINYEQQPWYKKKKKYGLLDNYLRTEEGLAILHALLPYNLRLAHSAALRYLCVNYALAHSFLETWEFIGRYITDPERRWTATYRQKRGLTDTSQPGGYSKDLVYFEGFLEVWHWLHEHDFNLTPLYYGKYSYKDVAVAESISKKDNLILPSFYILNPQQYAENLMAIGKENGLVL